jgi:hypothetical protein
VCIYSCCSNNQLHCKFSAPLHTPLDIVDGSTFGLRDYLRFHSNLLMLSDLNQLTGMLCAEDQYLPSVIPIDNRNSTHIFGSHHFSFLQF